MNAALALLAAALFLCAIGFVGLRKSPSRALRQRLSAVSGESEEAAAPEKVGRRLRRRSDAGPSSLAADLERAGIPLRPREAVGIAAGAACVVGAVMWIAIGPVLGLGAAVGVLLGGRPFLTMRVRRQAARMEDQLADALDLLVGALRAGYSLLQGLQAAARQTSSPLGDVLTDMGREVELGLPMEEALDHLCTRSGVQDMRLFASAVLVQRQVGGSLSEVLEHLSETIRERMQFRRKLQAMTAQNRMSMYVLGLLPPGVGVLMATMNPSLMSNVWSTLAGQVLLGLVAFLDLIGIMIIRSIIQVEV